MSDRATIDRILEPETIAIVGASTNPSKRGHQAIATLQSNGFAGRLYPVNPTAEEIRGLEVYPTVSAIPERIDLALIAVPGPVVPSVLEDCADVDVAGAIVIAVGFAETDDDGEELERRIVTLAREHDVRLIGPNTSGMINVHAGANLVGAEDVPVGDLALLCQSGNLAIALFAEAASREAVGFSHYVGVGNEADLSFDEYLPYFRRTEDTDAIVCYVEGFSDGRAFLEEARETVAETPIVVCKSGRSAVGKQSASSHTGSLAGDAAVADGVFRQAGVVSVERSDELLACANALASQPAMAGPNVGVLADGGGHATLAADALVERGLSVPELSEDTQQRLREVLPNAASVRNPVDVAGGTDDDPSVFVDCAGAICADPGIDALLVTGLFGGYGERFTNDLAAIEEAAASELVTLAEAADIPLIVQSAYESLGPETHTILRNGGVPVDESLDVAVACLHALSSYGAHLARAGRKGTFALDSSDSRSNILHDAAAGSVLSEYEAKEVLDRYDVPVTPYVLAVDAAEAEAAAASFDGPVAMKVVSPEIVHKTEADGVALDVSGTDVSRTYERLTSNARAYDPNARIDGVLVSPMRTDGVEVIVGATRDEQFGPVVMFGLGGTFVEVFEDVSFRAAPLSDQDACEMLAEIDASDVLDGARGGPAVDRESLVEILLAVSELMVDHPEVVEVDLNPVLARGDGADVLDASIVLAGDSPDSPRHETALGGRDE